MNRQRFVFGEELWNRGLQYNCFFDGNYIVPIRKEIDGNIQKSVYISLSLDSGKKQNIWNRLKMTMDIFFENDITISFFASDSKEVYINKSFLNLDFYLEDFSIRDEQKIHSLEEIWQCSSKNKDDILLHDLKGQYLWFQLEIITNNKCVPKISDFEIEFPMDSIAKYLPDFYSEDNENYSFITKLLGTYESLIYDLQYDIENVSKYLDIDFINGDYLEWLSSYLFSDLLFYEKEANWKEFIKKSFRFYQKKGTKSGLLEVLELYLGKKPIILEAYKIKEFYKNTDLEIKKLYGDNEYSFFVFIEDEFAKEQTKINTIKKLIEIFKPVNTKAIVVPLKMLMILGEHTYLGMNSAISYNKNLKLIENMAIPFDSTLSNLGG